MGRLGLVGPLGLVILAPLGTSLGLVGGVTFARRGREIALRSLTCEESLIYFTSPTHSSLRVRVGGTLRPAWSRICAASACGGPRNSSAPGVKSAR